jgi:hypothetical protein
MKSVGRKKLLVLGAAVMMACMMVSGIHLQLHQNIIRSQFGSSISLIPSLCSIRLSQRLLSELKMARKRML